MKRTWMSGVMVALLAVVASSCQSDVVDERTESVNGDDAEPQAEPTDNAQRLAAVAKALEEAGRRMESYQTRLEASESDESAGAMLRGELSLGDRELSKDKSGGRGDCPEIGCVRQALDNASRTVAAAAAQITQAGTALNNAMSSATAAQTGLASAQNQTTTFQNQANQIQAQVAANVSAINGTSTAIVNTGTSLQTSIASIQSQLTVSTTSMTAAQILALVNSLNVSGGQLGGLIAAAQSQRAQLVSLTNQLTTQQQALVASITTLTTLTGQVSASATQLNGVTSGLAAAIAQMQNIVNQVVSVRNDIGVRIASLNLAADRLHVVIAQLIQEYGVPENSDVVTTLLDIEASIRVDTSGLAGNMGTLTIVINEQLAVIASATTILQQVQAIQNQLQSVASALTSLAQQQSAIAASQLALLQDQQAVLAIQQLLLDQSASIVAQQQAIVAQILALTGTLTDPYSVLVARMETRCGSFINVANMLPLPISSATDLANMTANHRYVLTQSITLPGSWSPIAIGSSRILLDGAGHSITGMTIGNEVLPDGPNNVESLGLFAALSCSLIVNLNIDAATIAVSESPYQPMLYVGALAGSGDLNIVSGVKVRNFQITFGGNNSYVPATAGAFFGSAGSVDLDTVEVSGQFTQHSPTVPTFFSAAGDFGGLIGECRPNVSVDKARVVMVSDGDGGRSGTAGGICGFSNSGPLTVNRANLNTNLAAWAAGGISGSPKEGVVANSRIIGTIYSRFAAGGAYGAVVQPGVLTLSKSLVRTNVSVGAATQPSIVPVAGALIGNLHFFTGAYLESSFQHSFWDSSVTSLPAIGALYPATVTPCATCGQSGTTIAGQAFLESHGFNFTNDWQIGADGLPVPRDQ